jgi:hypothetical protein
MKSVCLALLVVLLALVVACSGPESFGSKAEYAALQSAEVTYRDQPISGPEIHTVQGYELLALPTTDGRTWIMLRAEHDPYWKQIPQTDAFSIPTSLLDNLVRENRVSTDVQKVLSSHVTK